MPGTVTCRASAYARRVFGARAAAGVAFAEKRHFHTFFDAVGNIFELNFHTNTHIRAASQRFGVSAAPAKTAESSEPAAAEAENASELRENV